MAESNSEFKQIPLPEPKAELPQTSGVAVSEELSEEERRKLSIPLEDERRSPLDAQLNLIGEKISKAQDAGLPIKGLLEERDALLEERRSLYAFQRIEGKLGRKLDFKKK